MESREFDWGDRKDELIAQYEEKLEHEARYIKYLEKENDHSIKCITIVSLSLVVSLIVNLIFIF